MNHFPQIMKAHYPCGDGMTHILKRSQRLSGKKYPNVKFEYTPVENGDLIQKYKTALITGGELPDIGWAVMAYRAEIFELDMWETIESRAIWV